MADDEKKSVSLYLNKGCKYSQKEIEDFFLEVKIKNYQDGYRQLIELGFPEMKKLYKRKGGKH
jgi:hypothetical protein